MQKSLSLLEARRSLNLTQVQIAEMLDITAEYVSMIERGKKKPSKKLLNKLWLLIQSPQAPPGAPAVVCHDKIRSEPCPRCAELERDLKEARAVIRDQASAIAALAAKPTVPPAGPACGAGCGISGVSKQKERKGA